MDGYGTPSDKHPSENAVTLQDILEFLSKKFRGTPFQGGSGADCDVLQEDEKLDVVAKTIRVGNRPVFRGL